MRTWASGSALLIIIAATFALSSFGHLQTLGYLAVVAIPISLALEYLGARMAIHATNAPDVFGRIVCLCLMAGCALINGYCEHRGLEALNDWQNRDFISSTAARAAANDTVSRLASEERLLPTLPNDAQELSRFRSHNPETTAFIEATRAQWATTNAQKLAMARATLATPAPRQIVEPLSANAIWTFIGFIAAFKILGFWSFRVRGAIVLQFPSVSFGKKKAGDASSAARDLANKRWGPKS